MKKSFLRKISMLLAMLMCISALGTTGVIAANEASVYVLPSATAGSATETLGSFDEYLATYGEGVRVSEGGGFKSDLFTVLLPGGTNWGGSYQKKYTEWQLVKLADGNGAIKTVSAANNTWFFRGNNFGKSWAQAMTGIKKIETKVKLDDADNCTVYPTLNYMGRADGFNRAEAGWCGLAIKNGAVILGSQSNISTDFAGTTLTLAEELQDNTWYKTETYFDFDNNKVRAIIYKVAEDGKEYPIADSGEEWVAVARQNTFSGIGVGAICGADSNITVDYFKTYDVENIEPSVAITDDGYVLTLSFSEAMTADDVEDIVYSIAEVDDLTVVSYYDANTNTAKVTFNASLDYETKYDLVITSGANTMSVPFVSEKYPTGVSSAFLLPTYVLDTPTATLGNFDEYLSTYGEGVKVSDGGGFKSDLFTVLLPGGTNWGGSYQKKYTEWQLVKLADGNGAIKTVSAANNTWFFRGNNFGKSWSQEMTGIKKIETKIKFDDADACIAYPTLNYMGRADGFNRAEAGWCGLAIKNGTVILGSQSNISTDFAGTTLTLAEELQDNTWYKTETYFDFDNNKVRAIIYKAAEDGKEYPIADSGEEWVDISRQNTFSGIGVGAVCGADSNITVDYFDVYDVVDITSPVTATEDGYEFSLGFNRDFSMEEIDSIVFSVTGIDDLSVQKNFDVDTNILKVSFNASFDFKTDYKLKISGDIIKKLVVSFKSKEDPYDVLRPALSKASFEKTGPETATLGDFDEFLKEYGDGFKVSDGGKFKNNYWTVLLPGGSSWGTNWYKTYTEWQIVKLSDENGAIKTVSTRDNTTFFRGNNFGSAWKEEMTGVKKIETKLKLDDADACTVYATVNYMGYAGDVNRAEEGWDGLIFTNGVVTLGGTTLSLAEELQDNTWYKTETYFDFDNNIARAVIYKVTEDGIETKIADSGEEWVSVTRQNIFSGIGIGGLCGANSNITVDYFSTFDISYEETMSNKVLVSPGRYYFKSGVKPSYVDDNYITLTKANGETVNGITAGYDNEKGLVYVDIPQLNYATDYILTFLPQSVVAEYDSYGKVNMGSKFVVDFTTISENSVVDSNKLLEKHENYVEMECEIYYDSSITEPLSVLFEGKGGVATVLEMSATSLILGKSDTVMSTPLKNGWYKVSAVFDYAKKNAMITVMMPDGELIQRADPGYLNSATSANKIIINSIYNKYRNLTVKTTRPIEDVEDIDGTTAKIVGMSLDGESVLGIKSLSENDSIVIAVDYTTNEDKAQDYTIYAAYYNSDKSKLVNAEIVAKQDVLNGTTSTSFDHDYIIGDLTNVSKIVFYVWSADGGLKPLSKPYVVGDTKFDDGAVDNLVTTFYGDEGTTRAFAWSAITEHTDMVIQYAEKDENWDNSKITENAQYTEYEGQLYYKTDIDMLEPGETYVYRIGDIIDDRWSEFYTFTTEPDNLSEFSFIGITDSQSSAWTGGFEYLKYTLDAAVKESPDSAFMVHLGDMVEWGPTESQWNGYFDATEGYAESLPHMTVMGNHESRGDALTAGKNYLLHFNNPQNGLNAIGNLTEDDMTDDRSKGVVNNIAGSVYSFDYGNAHFVVLNSGADWAEADSDKLLAEQAKWLRDDLGKTDKKWKIVMIHQSVYPAKTERYNTQKPLLDVIDTCGVDLVLQGHDHIVTRTYPMRNNQIVTKLNTNTITKGSGTVYSILGSAGAKRYETVTATPEYAAVLNATLESQPTYTVFSVNNDSIEVITKQINGVVVDKYTISSK